MTQKQERTAAGCLIAVLIPSVLVALLFFAAGLMGLFTKLTGCRTAASFFQEPGETRWFSVIAVLVFSFPILLVLARALHASIIYLRSGTKIRIVTWKTIAPASVLLGVPGLALAVLGFLGFICIDLAALPWAAAGALLLLAAPFILYRLEKPRKRKRAGEEEERPENR